MQLTKNFRLEEFTATSYGNYLKENESWAKTHILSLIETAQIMQKVRDKFGRIKITSGIRCPGLNRKIGGSISSRHLKGEAADFVSLDGVSCEDIYEWICGNLKFGQCILEEMRGVKWIHLSTGNKCEKLIYKNGKYRAWEGKW